MEICYAFLPIAERISDSTWWDRIPPAGHHTPLCGGDYWRSRGTELKGTESRLFLQRKRSLIDVVVHLLGWSWGYRCKVLGTDHIAGGTGKAREASDVQDIVAVGLGPWLVAHLFVEQIAFTNIGRFHALYSFSCAWKHLPKYCKSSWARDEEFGDTSQGSGPGNAWTEDLNPGFPADSPELQGFQQSFVRSFLDHMPCGLARANSE